MLAKFSKVAGLAVLAGATAHAAVSFDFQRLANRAQVERVAGVTAEGGTDPHRAARLAPAVPSTVASPGGGQEIVASKPVAVRAPAIPQMSAGTRRVLNALDAFEDEMRFYAGMSAGAPGAEAAGGAAEAFDPAGNILATLLPRAGKGLGALFGTDRGAVAPVAARAAGSAAPTRSARSGETVGETGFSALALGPSYPSKSGIAEPSPVPIPAGFPLLLGGLAAFAALSRRR